MTGGKGLGVPTAQARLAGGRIMPDNFVKYFTQVIAMDQFEARRRREWMLIGLVLLLAVLANLPHDLSQALHLNTNYLVAALGLMVLLALFLYVRFTFFLLYALLVVGANLPDQWADGLGVSRMPLLIALGFMVAGSLVNQVTRYIPSGLEPRCKVRSAEGTRALCQAVQKSNESLARCVLAMDIDPNVANEEGVTPLALAATTGCKGMVALLLAYGADPMACGKEGLPPLLVANRHGQHEIANLLREALAKSKAATDLPLEPDSGFIKT